MTVVYCLLQLVVVGVLPHAAGTDTPVAAALGAVAGPVGAVSAARPRRLGLRLAHGFAMMTPRILFSMASGGELPAGFAACSRASARLTSP